MLLAINGARLANLFISDKFLLSLQRGFYIDGVISNTPKNKGMIPLACARYAQVDISTVLGGAYSIMPVISCNKKTEEGHYLFQQ